MTPKKIHTKKSNFILNHGAFIQWFKLISQKENKKVINNTPTEKKTSKRGGEKITRQHFKKD